MATDLTERVHELAEARGILESEILKQALEHLAKVSFGLHHLTEGCEFLDDTLQAV